MHSRAIDLFSPLLRWEKPPGQTTGRCQCRRSCPPASTRTPPTAGGTRPVCSSSTNQWGAGTPTARTERGPGRGRPQYHTLRWDRISVSPDWSYFISELSGPEDLPCSSLGNYLITFFSVEDRAEGEQYTNTSDQWLAPLPGPGSSVDQSVPRDRETERHQALHSHLRAAQGLHLPQEYRQLVLPLWPRSYWNIILDKYTYHNVSTPPTNCFLGLGGYYQEYINIWEYVELSIYIPVLGPAAACRSWYNWLYTNREQTHPAGDVPHWL